MKRYITLICLMLFFSGVVYADDVSDVQAVFDDMFELFRQEKADVALKTYHADGLNESLYQDFFNQIKEMLAPSYHYQMADESKQMINLLFKVIAEHCQRIEIRSVDQADGKLYTAIGIVHFAKGKAQREKFKLIKTKQGKWLVKNLFD